MVTEIIWEETAIKRSYEIKSKQVLSLANKQKIENSVTWCVKPTDVWNMEETVQGID